MRRNFSYAILVTLVVQGVVCAANIEYGVREASRSKEVRGIIDYLRSKGDREAARVSELRDKASKAKSPEERAEANAKYEEAFATYARDRGLLRLEAAGEFGGVLGRDGSLYPGKPRAAQVTFVDANKVERKVNLDASLLGQARANMEAHEKTSIAVTAARAKVTKVLGNSPVAESALAKLDYAAANMGRVIEPNGTRADLQESQRAAHFQEVSKALDFLSNDGQASADEAAGASAERQRNLGEKYKDLVDLITLHGVDSTGMKRLMEIASNHDGNGGKIDPEQAQQTRQGINEAAKAFNEGFKDEKTGVHTKGYNEAMREELAKLNPKLQQGEDIKTMPMEKVLATLEKLVGRDAFEKLDEKAREEAKLALTKLLAERLKPEELAEFVNPGANCLIQPMAGIVNNPACMSVIMKAITAGMTAAGVTTLAIMTESGEEKIPANKIEEALKKGWKPPQAKEGESRLSGGHGTQPPAKDAH